jgi:predicted lactoylglutathione lyase
MATKIFLNLPVKDLDKSKDFFTKLGFSFNPQFTDEKAACLVLGENIFSMLLTEPFFSTFTKKDISDARKSTEVLIAIDVDSKEKVREMVQKAVDAGGTIYMDPQDHDWMYYHSFADLDGHQWEVMYMDESKVPQE